MATIRNRLRRLEERRTPPEKRRDEERAREVREFSGRQDEAYRARAEERPDLYQDLLEALHEYDSDLEQLGIDPLDYEAGCDPEHPIYRSPEFDKAVLKYTTVLDRFWHGFSCGFVCEDCGRLGDLPEDGSSEAECAACGGVVSLEGNFYKQERPLEGLKADVESAR